MSVPQIDGVSNSTPSDKDCLFWWSSQTQDGSGSPLPPVTGKVRIFGNATLVEATESSADYIHSVRVPVAPDASLLPALTYNYEIYHSDGFSSEVVETGSFTTLDPPAVVYLFTNGPLSDPGVDSVDISFSTNLPGYGRVLFGTSPTSLTQQVDDNISDEDHSVTISGLTANKTYYYMVQVLDNTAYTPVLTSPVLSFKTDAASSVFRWFFAFPKRIGKNGTSTVTAFLRKTGSGAPAPNVTVNFSASWLGGTLTPSSAKTDAAGRVSVTYKAPNRSGIARIKATQSGTSYSRYTHICVK